MAFDRKKPVRSRPSRSIGPSDKAGQKDEPEEPWYPGASRGSAFSFLSLSLFFQTKRISGEWWSDRRCNGYIYTHTYIYIYACCRREYGPGEKFTKRGMSIEAENHGDQILFFDVTTLVFVEWKLRPNLAWPWLIASQNVEMKDGFAVDCGHQLDIRYSFHTKISDDLKIRRKREEKREGEREGDEYRDGNTKMEKQLRVFEVCAFLRGDGIRNSRVWRDID